MTLPIKPNEADLAHLIEAQVSEGKEIDYKLQLSVGGDEEKKEFLADVVSFANTIGGHLIIGMKEQKGVPIELPGIKIDDSDQTKLKLEEIIREGVAPRIAGVSIHPLQLKNSNWAIVIYTPQSLSAPHMVSFKKSSRFYARNSAGKYQLDVKEIRDAFLRSESASEKIRDFRLDRVAKVGADDTSVTMNHYPKIILHSIPLSSFQSSQSFEISSIHFKFYEHSREYDAHRFNLDGVLFYKSRQENIIHEYLQMFRNGHFEYVNADIITPWAMDKTKIDIPSYIFERDLIVQAHNILSFQEKIGIEPPVYIILSFVGVKGLKMGTDRRTMSAYHNKGIDRDVLLIPEVYCENYPTILEDAATLLRPAFDAVWNSAGWPGSINYAEDGTWKPDR